MFLRKKWLAMLAVITAVLLLGACGDKGNAEQTVEGESTYDNPRNHTAEDFMPLSEGFEEYSIWFETSDDPGRKTYVSEVFVFENEKVTKYWNLSDLDIEDIIDLTDDEIIQMLEERSRHTGEGKYTLDITLDRLGQYTESIDVIVEDYTTKQIVDVETGMAESGISSEEEYLAYMEEEGMEFEVVGEDVIRTSRRAEPSSVLSLSSRAVSQNIYDTRYAGLKTTDTKRDEAVFTRVGDSFVGFRIDDPDTDKENVTIEEYE